MWTFHCMLAMAPPASPPLLTELTMTWRSSCQEHSSHAKRVSTLTSISRLFIQCSCFPERLQHSPPPPLYLSETQLNEAGFEPKLTAFLHLNYSSTDHVNTVRVPLGRSQDLFLVQSGTTSIILLCFIWVTVTAVRTAVRLNSVSRDLQGKID